MNAHKRGYRSIVQRQCNPKVLWLLACRRALQLELQRKTRSHQRPSRADASAATSCQDGPRRRSARRTRRSSARPAVPIGARAQAAREVPAHTGKYQHVKSESMVRNQPTGAQLNSKLPRESDSISCQMADFPSVARSPPRSRPPDKESSHCASRNNCQVGINSAQCNRWCPATRKCSRLDGAEGQEGVGALGSTAHAMLIRAIQDLKLDPNTDLEDSDPDAGSHGCSALKARTDRRARRLRPVWRAVPVSRLRAKESTTAAPPA